MVKAEVEYSDQAIDDLDGFEDHIAQRIVSKFDDVVWNPDHYLNPLTGSPYYKLRVGDYRAVVDRLRNEDPEVLFVREVGHRRNIWD